jgi:radical SAM protein with 4Fe4S-binding SPASM domain
MPTPPTNLILEIPSQLGDSCPVECKHCIHRNVVASAEPKLTPDQILDLIQQGRDMGVEYVNIYPHQGDISLEPPDEILAYFRCAQTLGLKTKSVTSGMNPLRLEQVLPFISRLALSVDALDEPTYSTLRPVRNYNGLMNSLELLKVYRKSGKEIFITALVMVNRMTIDNIEQRVADIVALGLFNKIKLLEMLPIGGARRLKSQALARKSDLQRLAMIKKNYQHQGLRVGVPLWRIEADRRGCQLGGKDLVVGPRGELAGCTLMFYLNHQTGNVHSVCLEKAWRDNFAWFREKSKRPVADVCHACPFFQADLCWGGCLARGIIFGHDAEVQRACGVRTPDDARRLYEQYLLASQHGSGSMFPLNAELSSI